MDSLLSRMNAEWGQTPPALCKSIAECLVNVSRSAEQDKIVINVYISLYFTKKSQLRLFVNSEPVADGRFIKWVKYGESIDVPPELGFLHETEHLTIPIRGSTSRYQDYTGGLKFPSENRAQNDVLKTILAEYEAIVGHWIDEISTFPGIRRLQDTHTVSMYRERLAWGTIDPKITGHRNVFGNVFAHNCEQPSFLFRLTHPRVRLGKNKTYALIQSFSFVFEKKQAVGKRKHNGNVYECL